VRKLHSGEPAPTLPVTDDWRRAVIKSRKNANLSQEEMARKLGVSQGSYSKIESGKTVSSNLVLQICSLVNVPPLTLYTDEIERQWMEIGQAMRKRSPKLFKKALALVEQLAGIEKDEE
jgi:transcriptional regulator with XRE-family HTH domain